MLGTSVDELRAELRSGIRRAVDRIVLVAVAFVALTGIGLATQLLAAAFAICALVGVIRNVRWSPAAYIALALVAHAIYLLDRGPSIELGAGYVLVITLAFMFLDPRWRMLTFVALAVTPVVVAALGALSIIDHPHPFDLDTRTWTRALVIVGGAMAATATVVGYAVRRLRAATQEIARALEVERETRREQLRVDHEIAHARRAAMIMELAAEVGSDIGGALAVVTARAASLSRELTDRDARACLGDVMSAAGTAASTMRSFTAFNGDVGSNESGADAVRAAREVPRITHRMLGPGIRLEIAAESAEAAVPMSPTDLLRILSNLVLNARDAISTTGTIRVGVSATATTVTIEVADNGSGMTDETRARAFQPFFTSKPVGRGTGLGLTTAKILVERAGGRIELASELGVGTRFTIVLPRVYCTSTVPATRPAPI